MVSRWWVSRGGGQAVVTRPCCGLPRWPGWLVLSVSDPGQGGRDYSGRGGQAVLWLLLRFHWGSALLVLPASTGLSSFHWTFKPPLGSSCCSADVKLLH